MKHKLRLVLAALNLILNCGVATQAYAATSENASIRLPAIYHEWNAEGVTTLPAISIDELDKCIGSDSKIRQNYNAYQAESEKLSAESKSLEQQINSLSAERDAIESEGKLIDTQVTKMNEQNAAIEKERAEISALSTNKKMDAAAAKNANIKINAFNSRINQYNTDSQALKARIQLMQQRQQKFNQNVVAPIKEKSDAFNEEAKAFRVRQSDYEAMIATYREKCVGNRQLAK